jgi:D-sedoheptulose 7-phosphate isomerase
MISAAATGTLRDAEVGGFLEHVVRTIGELDQKAIGAIIDRLFLAWQQRATVFVMGNGGSASTATHFAADLAKYTIVGDKPRFRVMSLTDNVPLVSAWVNDSGWGSVYVEQLVPWLETGDVLLGFSVHGGSGAGDAGPWSQNMVRAMAAARNAGASVLGFSGYDGGAMREMADHCVVVPALVDELGTPIIEGLHVVLHHVVVHALRSRIHYA